MAKTLAQLKLLLGMNICCLLIFIINVLFLPALIYKGLVLKEGNPAFEAYIKSPITIKLNLYFFNITNLDEYNESDFNSFEPRFEQVGPFGLNLERSRHNLVFGDSSLTSQTLDMLFIDEERSVIKKEDIINTVNASLISNYLIRGKVKILAPMKIETLLFRDKYGFLKDINNTLQPNLTVDTGERNIHSLYKIKDFDLDPIKYFGQCGGFKGMFEGAGFPPNKHNMQLFMAPFGRSFKFKFAGYSFGKTKFRFDKNSFNIASHRENKCYQYNEDSLIYDGMMQMLPTNSDMDSNLIYVSFPHFLYGSKELISKFDAMKPKVKKHESFYEIDTSTGLPSKVRMRFQINLILASKILPLFWQEIIVDIDTKMKIQLLIVHFLVYYMPVVEVFVIIALSYILYTSYRAWKQKYKVESVAF